jgi:hypothetical protein
MALCGKYQSTLTCDVQLLVNQRCILHVLRFCCSTACCYFQFYDAVMTIGDLKCMWSYLPGRTYGMPNGAPQDLRPFVRPGGREGRHRAQCLIEPLLFTTYVVDLVVVIKEQGTHWNAKNTHADIQCMLTIEYWKLSAEG